jgi:predicted nucleic acid-binding protein
VADPYVLVDTNAFITLTRGRAQVERLLRYVEDSRMVLSFATVAELRLGARVQNYSEASLRRLEADVTVSIVVAPTDALSHEWAGLVAEARAMGHALGQPAQRHDAWIAATARLFDLPILTEDADFAGFPGLGLLLNEP